MNVLLVMSPALSRMSVGSMDQFRNVDLGRYPPLGLMYVAAGIRQNTSHHVEILDLCCEEALSEEDIRGHIRRRSPDVVGVYATSLTLWGACYVAKIAKSVNADIKVVVGGPHVSLYPRETLAFDFVDYIVRGEGEFAMPALLDCIEANREPNHIRGVGYASNGEPIINPESELLDLDTLPLPARELTDVGRYYSVLGSNKIATTIMSSRGCAFNCAFCYQPYGHRVRTRSPDSICKELEACLKLGIKEIFFFDENFTMNARWASEVCDEIISRRLQVEFAVRSRVDTATPELLAKLKEAGCQRIQFGVESGSPEILKAMNKRITVEQSLQAFKAARRAGIITYADFMIGYPGETMEQMNTTFQFAKQLDPDYVQYGVTKFLPATRIYREALRTGRLDVDFWQEYARNPGFDVPYPIAAEKFDRKTLERIQRRAYIEFYFRPGYLLRHLGRIQGFRELTRQGRAAAGLLAGRLFS